MGKLPNLGTTLISGYSKPPTFPIAEFCLQASASLDYDGEIGKAPLTYLEGLKIAGGEVLEIVGVSRKAGIRLYGEFAIVCLIYIGMADRLALGLIVNEIRAMPGIGRQQTPEGD